MIGVRLFQVNGRNEPHAPVRGFTWLLDIRQFSDINVNFRLVVLRLVQYETQ